MWGLMPARATTKTGLSEVGCASRTYIPILSVPRNATGNPSWQRWDGRSISQTVKSFVPSSGLAQLEPRAGRGLCFELLRAVQQGPVFARRSRRANERRPGSGCLHAYILTRVTHADWAIMVPLTLPSLLIYRSWVNPLPSTTTGMSEAAWMAVVAEASPARRPVDSHNSN